MTNLPTHIVYHVKDVPGEDGTQRGLWTKVGAAWANKDARGLSIVLDVMPFDGRLVVRTALPDENSAEAASEDASNPFASE